SRSRRDSTLNRSSTVVTTRSRGHGILLFQKEHAMSRFTLILLTVAAGGSLAGCTPSKSETAAPPEAAATAKKTCEGDAGIAVPAGFCASIFADNLGHARHLAVAP